MILPNKNKNKNKNKKFIKKIKKKFEIKIVVILYDSNLFQFFIIFIIESFNLR